jgi:hypothetical protein
MNLGASVTWLSGGPDGPRKSVSVGQRPLWIAFTTAGNDPPQKAATGIRTRQINITKARKATTVDDCSAIGSFPSQKTVFCGIQPNQP